MKLWGVLYLTIWLVLGEFLLEMIPLFPSVFPYLHIALGAGLIAVTYWNFQTLRATRVPGRIKRVAKATFQLSVLTVALGVPLYFGIGATWHLPLLQLTVFHAILFFHIVNAFAIITQAAAVAIAYDMWEEHEFAQETQPGEIPPPPAMTPPVAAAKGA